MIRTALFVLATLALAGLAAWAQSTVPESDDSRYTFNRVDDGYLRLDGRTGQVSICARRPVGWTCEAVPDERAALEAEIARLQGGQERAACAQSAAAWHRQARTAGGRAGGASPAIAQRC